MPKQETKPSGNKKNCQKFRKGISQVSLEKKTFYKYASSKAKVRQGMSDLEKPNGILTTSDKEKAESLNSFFSSVFTVEESESPAVEKSTVQELLSNVTFTFSNAEKWLIALKPDKSPGPAKIHLRVLRELASQVAYPIYIIFKKSLSESSKRLIGKLSGNKSGAAGPPFQKTVPAVLLMKIG